MRRSIFGLVLLGLVGCGGTSATPTAFSGTWAGNMVLLDAAGNQTGFAAGVTVGIRDAAPATISLNEVATGRVTSPSQFDSVTGTFPTIYGPGYQGPGQGTTTITAGSGHLLGDTLTITIDETETDGTTTSYREVFTLRRSGSAGPPSSL